MKRKTIIDEQGKSHFIWEYEDSNENANNIMSDTVATVISAIGIVICVLILL